MMSDRPGIELNTVQLVSSMGAAVTGAVLTSYIGDGGTILGTAIGAGVSTAGFAVYKHYLVRTKEKVAPVIVEHARQWTPTGAVASDARPTRHDGVTRADVPRADATRADITRADDATRADRPASGGNGTGYGNGNGHGPSYTAADWEQARRTAPGWAQPTQAEPGWGPDPTRQDLGRTHQDPGPTRQDAQPTHTAHYGTVRMGDGTMVNGGPGPDGSGSGGAGSDGAGGRGSGGGAGDGRHSKPGRGPKFLAGRPGWVITVATAAVVFVAALAAITFIELGTGKPISASVWNRHQTGTTLGGSHRTTSTPSTTPTPTQSGTAPGSVGATGGAQSSPTPTTSSSPNSSPSPSSVPSFGSTPRATAPATGGAGAGAGSATVAPGQ
jgi:hypothetical protein